MSRAFDFQHRVRVYDLELGQLPRFLTVEDLLIAGNPEALWKGDFAHKTEQWGLTCQTVDAVPVGVLAEADGSLIGMPYDGCLFAAAQAIEVPGLTLSRRGFSFGAWIQPDGLPASGVWTVLSLLTGPTATRIHLSLNTAGQLVLRKESTVLATTSTALGTDPVFAMAQVLAEGSGWVARLYLAGALDVEEAIASPVLTADLPGVTFSIGAASYGGSVRAIDSQTAFTGQIEMAWAGNGAMAARTARLVQTAGAAKTYYDARADIAQAGD